MRAPVSFTGGVLVFTAIALAAVWGGYARLSRAVLDNQTQEMVARAGTMARAFEKHTHRVLHEVDVALRNIALNVAQGGLEGGRRFIERGFYDPDLIRHFSVTDAAGAVVCCGTAADAGAALDNEALVAFHRTPAGADRMHLGPAVPGAPAGHPLLRLSRRLNGPDGGFAGLVVANIDSNYLSGLYQPAALGPNGTVTLIGFDRVIRARGGRQAPRGIGVAIPHSKLWEELERSPDGVYWQDSLTDGLRRAFVYRRIDGYPLVVAVGAAEVDVEAAAAGLRGTLSVIAVLLSASIVLVATFLVEQHRTAERLRAALNVNRDFLARVSHELRTPLNAIIGFSEVIKEQMLGPQAGRRYADYAKDIHDSGRHLLTLIDDILDLSRLQAGAQALHLEPVDAAMAVDWAVRIIAPQAEAKGIRLEWEVPPGRHCITADEHALRQMLLNLLNNAVKFTPDGGCIQVTVGVGANGRCHIRIVDNGIGMTPEQLRQAAVPFGQTSALVTRAGQGTGLGLPIVKSLMEAHGGRLRIDSHPGRGSQVTLEFAA